MSKESARNKRLEWEMKKRRESKVGKLKPKGKELIEKGKKWVEKLRKKSGVKKLK